MHCEGAVMLFDSDEQSVLLAHLEVVLTAYDAKPISFDLDRRIPASIDDKLHDALSPSPRTPTIWAYFITPRTVGRCESSGGFPLFVSPAETTLQTNST